MEEQKELPVQRRKSVLEEQRRWEEYPQIRMRKQVFTGRKYSVGSGKDGRG